MNDEKNKAIGKRLKKAREQAHFATAREAAEALGVRYPTYASHENGSRGLKQSLEFYAKRFKVSLDWLLTGNEDRKTLSTENANIKSNDINDEINYLLSHASEEEKVALLQFLQTFVASKGK